MRSSDRCVPIRPLVRIGLIALNSLIVCVAVQAADGDAAKKAPIGQFITVTSPVDDSVFNRVSSAALKLQRTAGQEDRLGILVLQIEPGTSQFHHVQGLAKFLTSAQVSNLTTVAWIPATVTGPNVLVALACKQIVMHPDAELGDIGRGKPLDPEEQQAILALAQKRHNAKINSAIVRGMMDQQTQLWRVRLRGSELGKDELETRVVTKDELDTLRGTNVTIENAEVVKDAGMLGTFKGSAARSLDILVAQTLDSRVAVAAHYGLPREALRDPLPEAENRNVRLIKIEGIIDRLQESFVLRQIDRAVAEGSKTIVFQIDSPGGLLSESIDLANTIAALEEQNVRTIAYVDREAISGAAIISLGCDEIYMRPEAKIGDAGPIQIRPGEAFERAPEKILSPLKVALHDLAEKKRRPPALCEAMADRLMKVYQVTHSTNGRVWYMSELEIHAANGEWIKGAQLRETNGELLFTANGARAHELKIAEEPVSDLDDLKGRLGVPASMKLLPIERTWVDGVVFTLNQRWARALLIITGIALIYVELHFMTGILGILSVLCFSLFFWSTFMGGTAGWLEVVLFVLGLGCLGLEIFVLPGFGVFGVSGILLIVAALVMAGHSWSFDTTSGNIEELIWQTGQVVLSFGVVGILGVVMARYLPSIPGFDSMILGPPGTSNEEPQLRMEGAQSLAEGMAEASLGERGQALTMLRPAGKARIQNRVVNVISEGPFISADSEVEVVDVSGNRIVVRQI